jgi:hypothetical protein
MTFYEILEVLKLLFKVIWGDVVVAFIIYLIFCVIEFLNE